MNRIVRGDGMVGLAGMELYPMWGKLATVKSLGVSLLVLTLVVVSAREKGTRLRREVGVGMANVSEPLMNVGTRFEGMAWRGSGFGFGFGRESGDDKSAGGARAIRGDETLDTHRAGTGLTRQFQSRGKNTKRIPPAAPATFETTVSVFLSQCRILHNRWTSTDLNPPTQLGDVVPVN
ncbi:hypothetical protein ACNJ7E_01300 [Rhodococcus sp. NM-2]|uniref:hypothetical protein n=1 Tax=Rhodococcus sp. NM-2 TaxID=3401174 RepID=UPI003AADAC9A